MSKIDFAVPEDPVSAELASVAAEEHESKQNENPTPSAIKKTSLSDFKRDTDMKNILIKDRWAVRGTISIHVSTSGSGKSVLQTQAALCFNRGLPCCGLEPTRPFKSWVIQSEDDDDRVAKDRDDIIDFLKTQHTDIDWTAAAKETLFLDFTGLTGAEFLDTLDAELTLAGEDGKPDAVIINPLNAYFGGNLCIGAEVSAFFKGGRLGGEKTIGLEGILKKHNVWCWIFAHTGKPPPPKEQAAWLRDTYAMYKICGASETPDTARSIITFLKVPGKEGVFVFLACKNGACLGWKDSDGNPTNQKYFKWGDGGKHYWCEVSPEEQNLLSGGDAGQVAAKADPLPPRDDKDADVAVGMFKEYLKPVDKQTAISEIRNAVQKDRSSAGYRPSTISREAARCIINNLDAKGRIKVLPKGEYGSSGCMCGLPEVIDAYIEEQERIIKEREEAAKAAAKEGGKKKGGSRKKK